MTTEAKINDMQWWGEDGEWIAAPGHVDLAAFAAAADELARKDAGLPDDELPSTEFEPEHSYYRPITREWFDKNYPWMPPFASTPETMVDAAQQERYENYRGEGMLEPCEADAENAEPWTVVRTGA